jgi:hypothetical protein
LAGVLPLSDALDADRMKSAVNATLTAKGGDVSIIAIQVTQNEQTLNTVYDGLGGGWGWRRSGGGGFGGFGDATTTTETYQVGTLIVDLYDTKTRQLIWRGSACDTLSSNSNKNIKNLDKGVEKLFKKFPPESSK